MAFPQNTLSMLIHALLSLIFSTFITHGYLPSIIKNKTGDTSDKNNCRPIALVTAASKIFKLCLSVILENYLLHDQQFGFKNKHSTDYCIFKVKSVYTTAQPGIYVFFWMRLKPSIKLIISNYFESYLIVKRQ